jgi:hypothetical protein
MGKTPQTKTLTIGNFENDYVTTVTVDASSGATARQLRNARKRMHCSPSAHLRPFNTTDDLTFHWLIGSGEAN